jgi:AAA family ATP:ADP antiporter
VTQSTSAGVPRVLLRLVDVRPEEVRALVLAFFYFFFLLLSFYMLRPLRDEMGVASGVKNLQYLFTATFFVMLLAVPAYGWVAARLPKRAIVPVVYRFFILNILIFYALFTLTTADIHIARVFFVWDSVFNLFVVSVFWSLLNDLFRPGQAKRLFAFIAAGGTAGALTGPLVAALLAKPLGPIQLLLITAVVLELAVWCVKGLLRAPGTRAAEEAAAERTAAGESAEERRALAGGLLEGVGLVLRSPYLLGISLFFLLLTSAATFLYFIQAHFVRDAFASAAERTQVFASLDFATNALTVILQLFITGRLLKRFGLAVGLAVLPVVVALSFAALALAPVLVTLAAIQIVRRAAQYAVSRPSREALFTPLSAREKYKAKNVIDTAVYRGGDAGSGWAFAGLRAAGLDFATIATIMVPVALGWAALAAVLGFRRDRLAAAEEAHEAEAARLAPAAAASAGPPGGG